MNSNTNKFTALSLALGIISILSITSILLPLVFGSLAVIFAVLSKGKSNKMDKKSVVGLLTGLTSVILSVVITISTVYLIFYDPDYRKQFNDMYKATYGITFDEYVYQLQMYYNGETDSIL